MEYSTPSSSYLEEPNKLQAWCRYASTYLAPVKVQGIWSRFLLIGRTLIKNFWRYNVMIYPFGFHWLFPLSNSKQCKWCLKDNRLTKNPSSHLIRSVQIIIPGLPKNMFWKVDCSQAACVYKYYKASGKADHLRKWEKGVKYKLGICYYEIFSYEGYF